MNVVFALLADSANVSLEGKLNILGSFANIHANTFPVRHPAMQLVIRMEASSVEAGRSKKLEVLLVGPDGAKIGGFEADFDVPPAPQAGERINMQLIMSMVDTVLPAAGKYAVHVLIDGNEGFVVPISVEELK
ncbi:MAG: hypothetical protein WEB04_00610 [Dehalococcoidia bacterium]